MHRNSTPMNDLFSGEQWPACLCCFPCWAWLWERLCPLTPLQLWQSSSSPVGIPTRVHWCIQKKVCARVSPLLSITWQERREQRGIYIALLYTRISCKGWNVTSTVNSIYILLYKQFFGTSSIVLMVTNQCKPYKVDQDVIKSCCYSCRKA